DVAAPGQRITDPDGTGGAVSRISISDENDANDRGQRKQCAIWPLADLCHHRGAAVAHGHKHVCAEKNDQAENFEHETHTAALFHIEAGDGALRPSPRARIIAAACRLSMTAAAAHDPYSSPRAR